MLGDFGTGDFTANRTQYREHAFFILADQPRVAGDIDGQLDTSNCSRFRFQPFGAMSYDRLWHFAAVRGRQ